MNCSYTMPIGPLGINYLDFYYCSLDGYTWIALICIGLWLALLFYLLGHTADEYFSPTMSTLCVRFDIPFDVAGVTFLAFGNGAPDVFSSLASSTSGTMETGLNALLGGAMFVTTIVVGSILLSSSAKTVQIAPRTFCRDVLSLLGVVALISLCVVDKSTSFMIFFPIFYIAYVLVVVLPTCIVKTSSVEADHGVLFAFWHNPQLFEHSPSAATYHFITLTELSHARETHGHDRHHFSGDIYETYFGHDDERLSSPLIDNQDYEILDNAVPHRVHLSPGKRFRLWLSSPWGNIIQYLRWSTLGFLCFDLPRELTIPMVVVRPNGWSRFRAAMYMTTTPLFIAALSGAFKNYPHVDLAFIGVCIGLSLTTYVASYHRKAPTSNLVIMFFYLLGFAACVAWIYALASELLAVLNAIGRITTLPQSVIGLTILSWGNSVGDWSTNVAIARNGCGEMALAGCFGGPVFNILIGLGLPMLLAKLVTLRSLSSMMLWDVHCTISLAFLGASLLLTLFVATLSEFQCPRWYGKILFAIYVLYTCVHLAILLA
ncbi:Ca2 :Cation Antiporter (CaCA) Family [Thraustotheca clavata]|uniref:Ca2:Cation Antiporter (CaCA) Family n=1 Tax=Thraustotheca clavata TaxID=74557 RepID=A0A1W0AAY4_9STRA|nr:Ca2 :Cation Antiporter (CaCA) Family [Thraustotheca clavata]